MNTVMEVVKLVQNQQIHHGQITRLVHGLVIQVMQRVTIVAQHVQSLQTHLGQVVVLGVVIVGIQRVAIVVLCLTLLMIGDIVNVLVVVVLVFLVEVIVNHQVGRMKL